MAERVQGGSRVEDLRYTRYDGARRGRLACLASFARQGALHALGAGRGWRGKLIPFGLIFFAFTPALIVLGVRALFASRVTQDISELAPYSDYYTTVAIVILALAGMVTPELLCPDRRDRVLDLYYSTAVSPREYLAAKFARRAGAAAADHAGARAVPVRRQRAVRRAPARLPAGPLEGPAAHRRGRVRHRELLRAGRAGRLVAHVAARVRDGRRRRAAGGLERHQRGAGGARARRTTCWCWRCP